MPTIPSLSISRLLDLFCIYERMVFLVVNTITIAQFRMLLARQILSEIKSGRPYIKLKANESNGPCNVRDINNSHLKIIIPPTPFESQ
jgi:hypothetical protein